MTAAHPVGEQHLTAPEAARAAHMCGERVLDEKIACYGVTGAVEQRSDREVTREQIIGPLPAHCIQADDPWVGVGGSTWFSCLS
ncbi:MULTISPECIES: hypothetical protein [Rhodococcus]|uniref:Uncharacterized protein n=1 Tax=Rhodococcus jostii TaxID=132919 RepID=A0ABU4CIM0_RHOJO|nr:MULTISPECIES: hypothetical protein [Rhodococcus]MDH6286243.1 hypothetical protein [Rhodococcus opacus]MDI9975669.1 hypothetical protein [Rhodococcus sp. IEGM 1307]MDV6283075.1 hypothetical protein [Rhodococcus jostii]